MMKKKIFLALVSVVLIIIVLVGVYFLVNTTPATTVYAHPDEISAPVDQDFTFDIDISNVANLYAWECKFQWNTTVLNLVNVTEGSFLKNKGSTFFSYGLNETLGQVILDCTLLGEAAGVNGSGTLVSVKLHVDSQGTCELTLYDTKLVDTSEQVIAHAVVGGRFSTTD
jgi:Cohesin domain